MTDDPVNGNGFTQEGQYAERERQRRATVDDRLREHLNVATGHRYMAFVEAVDLLQAGYSVARDGWAGHNMCLARAVAVLYVPGAKSPCGETMPSYFLRLSNGRWTPWTPTAADMQATDWVSTPDVRPVETATPA